MSDALHTVQSNQLVTHVSVKTPTSDLPAHLKPGDSFEVSAKELTTTHDKVRLHTDKGVLTLPRSEVPESFEKGKMFVVQDASGQRRLEFIHDQSSHDLQRELERAIKSDARLQGIKTGLSGRSGESISPEVEALLKSVLGKSGDLKESLQGLLTKSSDINFDKLSQAIRDISQDPNATLKELERALATLSSKASVNSSRVEVMKDLLQLVRAPDGTQTGSGANDLESLLHAKLPLNTTQLEQIHHRLDLISQYDGPELLLRFLKSIKFSADPTTRFEQAFQSFVAQFREALGTAIDQEKSGFVLGGAFKPIDAALLRALREMNGLFNPSETDDVGAQSRQRELLVIQSQISSILELASKPQGGSQRLAQQVESLTINAQQLLKDLASSQNPKDKTLARDLGEILQVVSQKAQSGSFTAEQQERLIQLQARLQGHAGDGKQQVELAKLQDLRSQVAKLLGERMFPGKLDSGTAFAQFERTLDQVLQQATRLPETPPLQTPTSSTIASTTSLAGELVNSLGDGATKELKAVFEILLGLHRQLNFTGGDSAKTLSDQLLGVLQKLQLASDESPAFQHKQLKDVLRHISSDLAARISSASESENKTKKLEQLKTFERILRSHEVLEQLSPILKASGDPVFLLFPNLVQDFLSTLEVTFQETIDPDSAGDEQASSSNEKATTRATLKAELPKLGKVLIDLQLIDKDLRMELTFESRKVEQFVQKRLPLLEKTLSKRGLKNVGLFCKAGVVKSQAPEWVHALSNSGVLA